jgi:hypothetical protein
METDAHKFAQALRVELLARAALPCGKNSAPGVTPRMLAGRMLPVEKTFPRRAKTRECMEKNVSLGCSTWTRAERTNHRPIYRRLSVRCLTLIARHDAARQLVSRQAALKGPALVS